MVMGSFFSVSTMVWGSVLPEFPWVSVVWGDSFPVATLLSHKVRNSWPEIVKTESLPHLPDSGCNESLANKTKLSAQIKYAQSQVNFTQQTRLDLQQGGVTGIASHPLPYLPSYGIPHKVWDL